MGIIAPRQSLHNLEKALGEGRAQVSVFPMDWGTLLPTASNRGGGALPRTWWPSLGVSAAA